MLSTKRHSLLGEEIIEPYQEILKSVGWPTDVVILDFETYFDSDFSLTKLSTIEYITDDRFEFTGVGTASGPAFCPSFVPFPAVMVKALQKVYGKNLEGATLVVKNAKFDVTVLTERFSINPPFIIDVDDLARHYDSRISHRLKDLAKLFGLDPKGDTMQFKGLHWCGMSPEQKFALEQYCSTDVELEAILFKKLLPLMSTPEIELPLARHNLNLYLKPRLVLNCFKAIELDMNMSEILADIIEPTSKTKKEIGGTISFAKLLMKALPEGEHIPTKVGKPTKNMVALLELDNRIFGPWLPQPAAVSVPAFARDDVGFQDLQAHPKDEVRNLCKAREAVKSWPNHIKRIRSLIKQSKCSDGLLRVPFHYYGSHTGRDSGGENINLKNLGGRGRAGKGNHPLIGKVRGLIEAPEGEVMLISDSAQVEARILAWIAGQEDLTDGFKNEEDIYSAFASVLFQCEVRKPKENDSKADAAILTIKRGFGKDAILGCGYGMGAAKFFQRCMANESLRPMFESGEYNFAFIEKLIKTYRTKYFHIPQFWRAVEKAFRWVVKYPQEGTVYKLPGTNITLLDFWNTGGTVNLRLPSGRILYYRHCKLGSRGTITWHHGKLWGGSITENVIQAIARDLLVFWIKECEAKGIPVVFHCFDEIVNLIHEDDAQLGLTMVGDIMCSKPDWAEGLPLAVEGCVSSVYKK